MGIVVGKVVRMIVAEMVMAMQDEGDGSGGKRCGEAMIAVVVVLLDLLRECQLAAQGQARKEKFIIFIVLDLTSFNVIENRGRNTSQSRVLYAFGARTLEWALFVKVKWNEFSR